MKAGLELPLKVVMIPICYEMLLRFGGTIKRVIDCPWAFLLEFITLVIGLRTYFACDSDTKSNRK